MTLSNLAGHELMAFLPVDRSHTSLITMSDVWYKVLNHFEHFLDYSIMSLVTV